MPDITPPATPPLISADTLAALLQSPSPAADVLVLDCRFSLADPSAGEAAYAAGHIPGAAYAHLDHQLSSPRVSVAGGHARPGAFEGGRHPLPSPEAFQATLRAWGVSPHTHVVAYDDAGGMFAARAWWLLRWAGHERVQVLDGGWPAWRAIDGAVSQEPAARQASAIEIHGSPGQVVGTDEVLRHAWLQSPEAAARTGLHTAAEVAEPTPGDVVLIDARAPDRFRGENETIDPVGGHIPGAVNRFFQLNLGADGRFKPAAQLREEFEALLAGQPAAHVVHQCGSGVTACHNLLAMEQAGLPGSRLYAASWSAWVADPARPVER
ncbi:MAG: sulfurtransferase [Rubrivivax sp.]|nr:MAG: sulfurtransferase [Rubrivivax sp.]